MIIQMNVQIHDQDDAEMIHQDDGLLFDAELKPHRSLSPRGFIWLMSGICFISFSAGLAFFLAGAWPVVGFLGADVLLIYFAFRVNYQRAHMRETLQLTADRLTVQRISHWGEVQTWEFQPYWLQVLLDESPDVDSQLTLRSHGRSLVIGSFLPPDERTQVAAALKQALDHTRIQSGTPLPG